MVQLLTIKGYIRHWVIPAICFCWLICFANYRLDTLAEMVVESMDKLVQKQIRLRLSQLKIICHLINLDTFCLFWVVTNLGQPLRTIVVKDFVPFDNRAVFYELNRLINIDMFLHDYFERCLWYTFLYKLQVRVECFTQLLHHIFIFLDFIMNDDTPAIYYLVTAGVGLSSS